MTLSKYLDTNVILRLIIKDNLDQLKVITDLFNKVSTKKVKLFSSTLAIFETEWVLRSFYKFEKNDIVELLKKILSIKEINFSETEILNLTLENMSKNSLGLEDNYHISYSIFNNLDFFSFDEKANKVYKKLATK